MAALGTFLLLATFVVCSYAAVVSVVGARRGSRRLVESGVDAREIDENLIAANLHAPDLPDPDLLIRTSGELRISNFLLWQLAYAELVFVETPWPEFGEHELRAALAEYAGRERRFGGR